MGLECVVAAVVAMEDVKVEVEAVGEVSAMVVVEAAPAEAVENRNANIVGGHRPLTLPITPRSPIHYQDSPL